MVVVHKNILEKPKGISIVGNTKLAENTMALSSTRRRGAPKTGYCCGGGRGVDLSKTMGKGVRKGELWVILAPRLLFYEQSTRSSIRLAPEYVPGSWKDSTVQDCMISISSALRKGLAW